MDKNKWIAAVVCLCLTVIAYIGSTGLFYAQFRPIRNYDLVAFFGSWAGLIYLFIRDRNRED
ncbi:hypothetical protein [Bordetella avium]|uniref:Membrane protein n=1 Tax=Bordetella avium (strain 197N) TaxID=360910 RepID=Q2KXT4_BORA1|nr:hypothetical protein [Bordetella avium]AZY48161.1 hypothetical protein C0J09_02695 [Bordetella avium]AZY51541.1 hypothetical protein C0J07_02750 [Bordetella avium]RIQ14604.1 hypothetical protein D0432_00175 [Bordetella avium]RIQ16715.1 hypothetical protein D0850_13090 [Bordetella avium]RIQ35049.1 hypothetical protein D0849_03235 [Bordetella avium]